MNAQIQIAMQIKNAYNPRFSRAGQIPRYPPDGVGFMAEKDKSKSNSISHANYEEKAKSKPTHRTGPADGLC